MRRVYMHKLCREECSNHMVLISDGSYKRTAHLLRKTGFFLQIFDCSRSKQMTYQITDFTPHVISELPSNITTMVQTIFHPDPQRFGSWMGLVGSESEIRVYL